MKKYTSEELKSIYSTNNDLIDRRMMFHNFCNQYNITSENIDKSRFITFTDDEITEIHTLAQGRYNNNRKNNTNQVKTGCGNPVGYLERDYPGVFGEKAFLKFLKEFKHKNLTNIDSIECSAKSNDTDEGDFIVPIGAENIKFEVKCNQFDPTHSSKKFLNVQYNQIQIMREKRCKPHFFVQVIMVSPKIAYISGYADWFTVINGLCNADHGSYYRVPYDRIKYFSLNNIPEID